jgi:hypothetical protein
MAICDYCGVTYRGGAIKDGAYRYCTGHCCERGRALLSRLDHIPQSEIDLIVASAHKGPCECCGRKRNVDVYSSYRIWSAWVYLRWQTNSFVLCRECARKRQNEDLVFCLIAGWWSPPGVLITPFFIGLNIAAMLHHRKPAVTSDRFRKLIRINLARSLSGPAN